MRGAWLAVAMLGLAAILAGCSQAGTGDSSSGALKFGDRQGSVSDTTGLLRGIIVDPAIVPIAGAKVAITSGAFTKNQSTDSQGRFLFDNLPPGTYLVKTTHLLYETAQTTADVVAGVAEPNVIRLAMQPKFSQKPFHDQREFKGYILCGYQAALSSPCVFDYTQLACGGGCDPTLHDLLIHAQGDTRYFITSVGPGWQTEITEMSFESPQVGVSHSMTMSYSYFKRTASEYMGTVSGASPLLLRLELGKDGPGAAGPRHQINATGNDDLYIFINVAHDAGGPAGIALNQKFDIFETTYYNAKPQEGWSFLNGDPFPF